MSHTPITIDEANALVLQLVLMPISLPWHECGSAIFGELGKLDTARAPTTTTSEGQSDDLYWMGLGSRIRCIPDRTTLTRQCDRISYKKK